jgi:hypothetical protein
MQARQFGINIQEKLSQSQHRLTIRGIQCSLPVSRRFLFSTRAGMPYSFFLLVWSCLRALAFSNQTRTARKMHCLEAMRFVMGKRLASFEVYVPALSMQLPGLEHPSNDHRDEICVYVHVCMFVCVCIYIHIHIYVCVYTYIHTCQSQRFMLNRI